VPAFETFDYDSSREEGIIRSLFSELVTKRDLVVLLVRRDLHVRYRRSILGLLWSLLNPLLSSLVLWFVFVNIFHAKLANGVSFAPYVLAGVLLITFFSQGFLQVADSIAGGIGILQKVYVRPEVFAASSALSSAVNFMLGLFALVFVNLLVGDKFSPFIPMTTLVIVSMMCLITGLGLMTAILFIKFDDSRNIVNVLVQLLTYLTPVFYPKEILGKKVEMVVSLNPLSSYLDVFRSVFTDTGVATTFDWFFMFGSAFGSLMLGIFIFNQYWHKTVVMM
jgi:ABC-type polysaccharide/polyol phosphate export permease